MAKVGKMPLPQTSSQSSLLSQDLKSPLSSPSSTRWDNKDKLLLVARIRARKTREEVKESEINARANSIMKEWLEMLRLYRHGDVLQWFRDEGESQYPAMALLARIHLGKISSSAFQERVFSTGGMIMGPLRTRTDSRRSEKQVRLRHNRNEIVQDARKSRDSSKAVEWNLDYSYK